MKLSSSTRRVLWILALVLLAIGTPAAGLFYSWSAGETPPSAAKAGEGGTGEQGVVCFGTVDLEHGVTALLPLQPGRVSEVLVHEGESVSAGTVLVRLEDGPARSRVAEARAALEAAQMQLTQARKSPQQHRSRIAQQQDAVEAAHQRLSAARRLLARKKDLAGRTLIDSSEVDVAEAQVRELEALERVQQSRLADLKIQDPRDDERRADQEVAMMRARLDQAQDALVECAIKAPRRGTVLRLLVGPGDVLVGQPRQPAVQFAIDGPQVIRAEVEQEFADRVAVGQPAAVEDADNSARTWRGKVEHVANWFTQRRSIMQEPTEFKDVRTVECLIGLEPGQPSLRLGLRVRVFIGAVKPY